MYSIRNRHELTSITVPQICHVDIQASAISYIRITNEGFVYPFEDWIVTYDKPWEQSKLKFLSIRVSILEPWYIHFRTKLFLHFLFTKDFSLKEKDSSFLWDFKWKYTIIDIETFSVFLGETLINETWPYEKRMKIPGAKHTMVYAKYC